MGSSLIPWCILVSPEFITERGRISIRQWYLDPRAKVRALAETRKFFEGEFGMDPVGEGVSASPPSYTAVNIISGAELVMPEDDMPMIRGYPLKCAEEVERLLWPSAYLDHAAMAPYVEQYRQLKELVGDKIPVGLGPGTQGPITMAKLLRGQDFFADLLEFPEEAHRLVEFVTDVIIHAWREVGRFTGEPTEGGNVAIHDDFAGLMGPELYGEFAVPSYKRIYEAFKPKLRLFHSELLRPVHLRYLKELRVDYLNLGEDQYLTPKDVLEATDVPFEWHVKTATVTHGTRGMVEEEYLAAVREGAPAILTELCARNMRMENIRAFIEIAREHGPFVAPSGCYVAAMKAGELEGR